MSSKTLKKEIRLELAKLAVALPKTYRQVTVLRVYLGQELINEGITELKNGEVVLPKKKYSRFMTDKVPVNNMKKLVDLYQRDGIEAVRKYCEGVMQVSSGHIGQKVGGLTMESDY